MYTKYTKTITNITAIKIQNKPMSELTCRQWVVVLAARQLSGAEMHTQSLPNKSGTYYQ